jgi:hypothetical protein
LADELSVDNLEDLWRAGAVLLPTAAVQFAEMASKLHQTSLNDGGAFSRTEGGLGPLHPVWTGLRDTMQDSVAVKTHDNLVAGGDALRQIAESYATAEYLSTEDLNEFNNKIENSENDRLFEPPPYVPDAPSTDDPHPEDSPQGPGYN